MSLAVVKASAIAAQKIQLQPSMDFPSTRDMLEMLEDIITGRRKQEFVNATVEWKWKAIRKYKKLVVKFEELLLVLVQET
jgi:hypothetical protein